MSQQTTDNTAGNSKSSSSGKSKSASIPPVIADLGRRSRKQIKDLRAGHGKLLDEVQDCIQELQASGTIDESAQPVVVLVTESPVETLRPAFLPPSPAFFFPPVREESDEDDDD